jgi:hypothetical protein
VSDARPISETDTFDLHQAYVRFGDPKQFPLSAKVGRQEMLYGDERYVGISDWSNFGRSFDAAKARFEQEAFWVETFAGRLVIPRDDYFNVVNDYDWFSGVYASTRQLVPWQDSDLFFFMRNVGANSPTAITPTLGGPGPRDIYTVGDTLEVNPRAVGELGLRLRSRRTISAALTPGGTRIEHQAFAVNGSGGYTLKDVWATPRLGLGYDFGSGDSDPNDDKNETVRPPLRHQSPALRTDGFVWPAQHAYPAAGRLAQAGQGLDALVGVARVLVGEHGGFPLPGIRRGPDRETDTVATRPSARMSATKLISWRTGVSPHGDNCRGVTAISSRAITFAKPPRREGGVRNMPTGCISRPRSRFKREPRQVSQPSWPSSSIIFSSLPPWAQPQHNNWLHWV